MSFFVAQKGDNYTEVEAEKGTLPTIKTFTVCGTTYEYEEGMLWNTWLLSSYNTTGAFDHSGYYGSPAIIFIPPSRGVEIINDLFETEVSQSSIITTCENLPS